MSDHICAKLTYPALPEHATCMLGDKGYDSDEYRAAMQTHAMHPAAKGADINRQLRQNPL